jgi:hypothetical protein
LKQFADLLTSRHCFWQLKINMSGKRFRIEKNSWNLLFLNFVMKIYYPKNLFIIYFSVSKNKPWSLRNFRPWPLKDVSQGFDGLITFWPNTPPLTLIHIPRYFFLNVARFLSYSAAYTMSPRTLRSLKIYFVILCESAKLMTPRRQFWFEYVSNFGACDLMVSTSDPGGVCPWKKTSDSTKGKISLFQANSPLIQLKV